MKKLILIKIILLSQFCFSASFSGDVGLGYYSGELDQEDINGVSFVLDVGLNFQDQFFIGGLTDAGLGSGGYNNYGVLGKYKLVDKLNFLVAYIFESSADLGLGITSEYNDGSGYYLGVEYLVFNNLNLRLSYQNLSFDERNNGLFSSTVTFGDYQSRIFNLSVLYAF